MKKGLDGVRAASLPSPPLTWGNKINLSDVMNVKLAQICHNYSLTLHCVQLLTQINLTHIDKEQECCNWCTVQRDDRCSMIWWLDSSFMPMYESLVKSGFLPSTVTSYQEAGPRWCDGYNDAPRAGIMFTIISAFQRLMWILKTSSILFVLTSSLVFILRTWE